MSDDREEIQLDVPAATLRAFGRMLAEKAPRTRGRRLPEESLSRAVTRLMDEAVREHARKKARRRREREGATAEDEEHPAPTRPIIGVPGF